MMLKVNQGKGAKDRYVPISPRLLIALRAYWKECRPSDYLFPGKTDDTPLNKAVVQKACSLATAQAKINKHVTPHTMRHSYATGLLEAGVDLMAISKLLGHSSFLTTMVYLHCRRQHFENYPSPIDWLPVRQCPKWIDPAPSVHSLLLKHTERTLKRYGQGIPQHVENTLLRMHYCRTPVLGTRHYRCDPCDFEKTVYNSCGDRNCPNCSGAKRRDWLDKTRELVAPGVTYFQVVFTLPAELSSLALGNRKEMYDLLFRVAWSCLSRKIEKELGIQSAAQAVLHTWNQRTGHHPHVHFAVPGNGPSLDGTRWVPCKPHKAGAPFLVDNKELGAEFRDKFLKELQGLIKKGKIRLEEPGYIADMLSELSDMAWNVFIERPPVPGIPSEQMFKYLAKYMTGGPISDRRILGE
jgi:hypothetical protein